MFLQNVSLPFDYTFGVPMIIFWIVAFIVCLMLFDAKAMSPRVRNGFYFFTFILAGIILGGIPNAVMPIQQLITTIGKRGGLSYLFPAIVILLVLLGTSLLVGRIFCGFLCPLGTLQEILSKINFKSDLKSQKKVAYNIEVSQRVTNKIRWVFFGITIILAVVWGIVILPEFNPFLGFSFFKSFMLTLPFIFLIIVIVASIFLYRPWCRFLCPFGATTSVFSRFARIKYQYTEDCTECGNCEKICPTQEAAKDSRKTECYFCNRCVEVCPNNAIVFNLG